MINKIFLKYFFAISILFLFNETVFGQLCNSFHTTPACSPKVTQGFQKFGQSKSGMLEINKPFEYKLVLYGGKDYIFVVCTESGYKPIHYRIINAQTKEVVYDNTEDEYIESVGFTNDYTQTIILEITVLAENIEPQDAYDARACVGINILWRKVPKIGF
ncbi:MAG: hypothetical protein A2W99_03000 [Bacteroidetes bacterium GWF2_33_16]|nr:MAG: hypothetical protein A2X00_10015 [Bacteroidetes bacterium GWE2_32_14]OFY07862.1 MAG: hypothetical protein A2W99_03000 [Bacteroidetes bacterium GWF2_33_16]